MCAITTVAIYLCLLLPSVLSGSFFALPEYHSTHPVELNEAALRRLANGDDGTALILLERAAVLAPHDATIIGNRDALRVYRTEPGSLTLRNLGTTASAERAPATAVAPTADLVWPSLPTIWPLRR